MHLKEISLCFILSFVMFHIHAMQDLKKNGLSISTFDIDVTPPLGNAIAYGTVINRWDLGLRARGIVLLGNGKPIVLCAVDWIGIGNEGYDAFCSGIARNIGTTPDRVAIHTVHQHDTPTCDLGAEKILHNEGLPLIKYESSFSREVIQQLGKAVKESLSSARPLTGIGFGTAAVSRVASNRRILAAGGDTVLNRLSSCQDSLLRAAPEGLIDPEISLISFWDHEQPVAILSYYAVHPQSYYRTGVTNPDFAGVARFLRQLEVPRALHVHFNGAAGNVAAGKYNDGSPENRGILARRLAEGMKKAWESTVMTHLDPDYVRWNTELCFLPPAQHLFKIRTYPSDSLLVRSNAARLAWLDRCQEGKKIIISCLSLGNIRILHLPGEPFVEFQLAAKAFRGDLHIAVAAYGDYGPGYIGTREGYALGGYETGYASNVTPEAGDILLDTIKKLLMH
jgi:hypothetical protein